MKLKIFATAALPVLLASGIGVASAGAAQASSLELFSQSYSNRALCKSVAIELRQSLWHIKTDCIAPFAGSAYVLQAERIKV
ncbi:hypothetical protein [Cellulomonas sp. URHE0023]|uniref:hypothetical protein n=1 Tax=Cellulomonas sp. URHE0023 TaxID=1380354 RepID=UPI000488CD0C|nr:hypothetical protein [Cellulomonas sp. URHE0023]